MRIVLLLLVVSLLSCRESKPGDTSSKASSADAISSASVDKEEWLPEPSERYKILGYNSGLKGVLIQYSDSVYRGGDMLSVDGAKLLKSRGIQTVYSITPSEAIRSYCQSFGFDLHELVFDYQGLSDSQARQFVTSLDTVTYPIYIHCHSGKQRGGNLAVLYRVFHDNWQFESALEEYGNLGGKVDADREMLARIYRMLDKKSLGL